MNDAQRKMQPVGWFEIYVADMKRAEEFYSALFGFKFGDMPAGSRVEFPMRAFPGMGDMEAMGITGALILHPEAKPGLGGTLVYFSVPELAKAVAKVRELGAEVYLDVTPLDPDGKFGKIAIVGDSEGNAIGLHSHGG